MRVAGSPRGALGRRHRRATAAARRGARAGALVYLRDGRAGLRHRCARPAERPDARHRDRDAARLRCGAVRAATGRASRGLDLPRGAEAGAREGRRLRFRHGARGELGPRLCAVRRADSRRGHHRLGSPELHRRQAGRRARILDRFRDRALRAHAWRPAHHGSPGGAAESHPGSDGRGHDRGGGRDDRQPRHPLREHHREAPPAGAGRSHEPDRVELRDLERHRRPARWRSREPRGGRCTGGRRQAAQ